MVTVITEHGTLEIPPEIVAEGEQACGAWVDAQISSLSTPPAATSWPTPTELAPPSEPEE